MRLCRITVDKSPISLADRGHSAVRFRSKHPADGSLPSASGSLLWGHTQLRLWCSAGCLTWDRQGDPMMLRPLKNKRPMPINMGSRVMPKVFVP